MKSQYVFIILGAVVLIALGCEKKEETNSVELKGKWVCDTIIWDNDYYATITFTSATTFDYYEDNGLFVLEEKGTYRHNPPKIFITIWDITIEGSVSGNILVYPTLATDELESFHRQFKKE
ncbi:MAG TPA: hypothetical protein DDX98_07175 [Bacteroidales bacterium]|jgi:hypothetical protein|nr:hypothetical protein [Bacteroidales bacterium]